MLIAIWYEHAGPGMTGEAGKALPTSAQKVQDALAAGGFDNQVVEMPESTRSAADAAGAVEIFIDEDLMAHEAIWAAAGTPRALFRLTPDELRRMTGGRVIVSKA